MIQELSNQEFSDFLHERRKNHGFARAMYYHRINEGIRWECWLRGQKTMTVPALLDGCPDGEVPVDLPMGCPECTAEEIERHVRASAGQIRIGDIAEGGLTWLYQQ